jgi:hypothetical protein
LDQVFARNGVFRWVLAAVLLLGLGLRLIVLFSPLGELDADEAA